MAEVKTQHADALPGPDEWPDADVVIYDSHCRICRGQIRRLARWDGGGRLAYMSLHDPSVAARYPDLTYDLLMQAMVVVDRSGRRHIGAAAVRYLTRRLPKLWWLAPILNFPGTLAVWQWCYRQIANRRYRFGKVEECDGGTCSLHFGPKK